MLTTDYWIAENEYEIHIQTTTPNGHHHSTTYLLQEFIGITNEVGWDDVWHTHNISVEGEWLAHRCSWDGYENGGIEACSCEPECEKSFDVVTIKLVPKP